MQQNVELFQWEKHLTARPDLIIPSRPQPLSHSEWPPNYKAVYAWRIQTLQTLRANPHMLASAKAYYSLHRKEFICDWMDTYDPRKIGIKWVPFVFFEKQGEFIDFLEELRISQQSGLVEKARDMGATWLACGYSIASWLFINDDAIGWGSRKQELVDKIGDASSIFEKLRMLVRRLPNVFKPEGLDERKHLTFMKCINPANGATIIGETGDNIGRGGRTGIYFKDESAHYERPEKIQAALDDNTNVQVDISSVNGLGNVFYNKRDAGIVWQPGEKIAPGYTRVFLIDWRDHPAKTQAWYDERRAKNMREGTMHLFAQEVDRDYSAAISNTVIPYEYIQAAVDAHLYIPCLMRSPDKIPDIWFQGLDVADGGKDRNGLAKRQWVILRHVEEWGERDTGITTRRAIAHARQHKHIRTMYDAIGVGAGVKSEYNRITIDEKIVIPTFTPWNAGAAVLDPYYHVVPGDDDSLTNDEFFKNLKAQAWWSLYTRFYKTWSCIQAIKNNEPIPAYDPDELISLDSTMPLLLQLMKELAQPVKKQSSSLQMIVDKQPDDTKSPNLADAVVMAYFPIPEDWSTVTVGSYG